MPVTPGLSAINRAFPGAVAWAVGPLDGGGQDALLEIACLAWTGLQRMVELGMILVAARTWRHAGLRYSPGGLSARALLYGFGTALTFGLAVCLVEALSRTWGASLYRDVLLGSKGADPVYATRGVQLAFWAVGILFGPAVEELFFRGVLLDTLMAAASPFAAILVSAAIFACFHYLVSGGIPLVQFLGGLAFAWLTLRTGGLGAAWILHASANAFVLLLEIHYQGSPLR